MLKQSWEGNKQSIDLIQIKMTLLISEKKYILRKTDLAFNQAKEEQLNLWDTLLVVLESLQ